MSETLYRGPVIVSAHAGPRGAPRLQLTILSGSDHAALEPREVLETATHMVLWIVDRQHRPLAAAELEELQGLTLDNLTATVLLSAEAGCRARFAREKHVPEDLGAVLYRFGALLGGMYANVCGGPGRGPLSVPGTLDLAPMVVAFAELLAEMALLTGMRWTYSFIDRTDTDSPGA